MYTVDSAPFALSDFEYKKKIKKNINFPQTVTHTHLMGNTDISKCPTVTLLPTLTGWPTMYAWYDRDIYYARFGLENLHP